MKLAKLVNPPELHAPVGGDREATSKDLMAPADSKAYSHASISNKGKFVAVAGQVPVDERGRIVGVGNIEAQTDRVLENIRIALKACGADIKDIVRTRTFITDMRNSKGYIKVKENFFKGRSPPGTLVEVNHLYLREFLIEMEADAIIED